jgi:hypothetical protein
MHHIHSRIYVVLDSTGQEKHFRPVQHVVLYYKEGHLRSEKGVDTVEDKTHSKMLKESFAVQSCSLTDAYRFGQDLQSFLCHHEGHIIIVCSGRETSSITGLVFNLGTYLILSKQIECDHFIAATKGMSSEFAEFAEGICIIDCLRAIEQAKIRGWLDFRAGALLGARPQENSMNIDMLEYIHYDLQVNGKLHIVIPEKLLVFQCPVDLPQGQDWVDQDGTRAFSPAYYADIFADFNVKLVIRVCPVTYSAEGFQARGIEVEDLDFGDDVQRSMLGNIDRFLTLARCTPGAIAVHGAGHGLGLVSTMVAAHLISAHGFPARAAVAWLRIASPAAVDSDAAHRTALRELEQRVRSAQAESPTLGTLRRSWSSPRVGLPPLTDDTDVLWPPALSFDDYTCGGP